MFDDFTKMMLGSLGLEEPWYIDVAKFNADEKALHIYVDIRKAATIACPKCGGTTLRYGYEPSERVWRHADCLFYPTYIHCRRPRVHYRRWKKLRKRFPVYIPGCEDVDWNL